jgi:hypothetical protein
LGKKPHIFVCPLDWGIGHATRCVPVVRGFLQQGARVTLGASGRSFAFLEKEFPDLPLIKFPGVSISYPEKGERMPLHMLLQSPNLLKGIRDEHSRLKTFIQQYGFDGVVSDNRYGLYSAHIPTVLITHQVFIQAPGPLKVLERILEKQTKGYIRRFDLCWIPDIEGDLNLSGDLSHKKPLPDHCRYIGALSRFASLQDNPGPIHKTEKHYDVLCLLSGPEPQRTLLEQNIFGQLRKTNIKAAIVLGKPETESISGYPDHIDVFPHLETSDLFQLLNQSALVIARPGYSTIMDLAVTGNKAMLIPTPGQTEQEYLGNRFEEMGIFQSVRQKDFDLQKAISESNRYSGLKNSLSNTKLEKFIDEFLKLVEKSNKTKQQ